ncbi:MAG: hypothetical protein KJ048_05800 [Dehalococcoidia bacterium]|nr:hypothetical protein [Dehalococcoidia bacterium]
MTAAVATGTLIVATPGSLGGHDSPQLSLAEVHAALTFRLRPTSRGRP